MERNGTGQDGTGQDRISRQGIKTVAFIWFVVPYSLAGFRFRFIQFSWCLHCDWLNAIDVALALPNALLRCLYCLPPHLACVFRANTVFAGTPLKWPTTMARYSSAPMVLCSSSSGKPDSLYLAIHFQFILPNIDMLLGFVPSFAYLLLTDLTGWRNERTVTGFPRSVLCSGFISDWPRLWSGLSRALTYALTLLFAV